MATERYSIDNLTTAPAKKALRRSRAQVTEEAIIIVRQRQGEFGDGLLGMSFLAGLKYTIDFQRQSINWIP